MNRKLDLLHPYPFEKLRVLFGGIEPNRAYRHISLGIGEPKHATPAFIQERLAATLSELAFYPATQGSDALRAAITDWLKRRYGLREAPRVLPVNGTREALFAFAQTVIDAGAGEPPLVICPNPFYQIYEGAALLAGAATFYLNQTAANNFACDWSSVPEAVWQRTQLIYVCSPCNPTGDVMQLDHWRELFELSDRYGLVIASDECYSEIYFDEVAPLGSLAAAAQLGRSGFPRLVMFSSLSKRSNVPGLRSGFVAGDAALLEKFLLYRTYHGSAMSPPVQAASIAAWGDETHVADNRRLYREKFDRVVPMLESALALRRPPAGFYLWAKTPLDDTRFASDLFAAYNVTVLPGSYLGRSVGGVNPGSGYVRLALVAALAECAEAAERIAAFCHRL